MEEKINKASKTGREWRQISISERAILMQKVSKNLQDNFERYAALITKEMGKPITQAEAEVKKCALVCDYYATNAPTFLADKHMVSEASESFVRYDPLGVILGVMPWNFPFWQVFRFAVPTLMAGNTVLVKHASNVSGCAALIEDIFIQSGFPDGAYQNLPIQSSAVEAVIAHPAVKAISLTGSEDAGKAVSSTAAKHLKKSVLELGGSNAFIICADADLTTAVPLAVTARMQNAGQSCIAGKRFIVHHSLLDAFTQKFADQVAQMKFGDPQDRATEIGPIAREDLAEEVERQVNDSIAQGAKVVLGAQRKGAYYSPTVLSNITPTMPVFAQEVFGPVAPIIGFTDFEEAIALSNASEFGLGVSVITKDVAALLPHISSFQEGCVFINEMVKSDPKLPFGGIKKSGFGRELSEDGIKEFVNVKTVYIK